MAMLNGFMRKRKRFDPEKRVRYPEGNIWKRVESGNIGKEI